MLNGRLYQGVDTAAFLNGVCEIQRNRCAGRVVEKIETEWWIQIRTPTGEVGWTNEPVGFDGKDAPR
jgi:hypothetical protein